jgi:4-carboxymuconolactone decarboxylase
MIGAGDAHSRRNRSEARKIRLLQARQHGDIWERPGLSKRDRSLIVIASLISTYRPEQLRGHLAGVLDNGVMQDEIAEVITHLAFYSGWPASMTAARLAKEVFEEPGLAWPPAQPHTADPTTAQGRWLTEPRRRLVSSLDNKVEMTTLRGWK